jgi:hypothetical protein
LKGALPRWKPPRRGKENRSQQKPETKTRPRLIPVDEIASMQGRLMDWAQIMTAVSAGAAGILTIQKVIKNLKSAPPDKPIENGERRKILTQLIRLEQMGLNQEVAMGRIDGRMDDFDDRLRVIERTFGRSRAPEYPNSGSTD